MDRDLAGNGQGDRARSHRAHGAACVLSLEHAHGAVTRAPDVALRHLSGSLGIASDDGGDEFTVLPPGYGPGVEPEDVDPGQEAQAIVELIERVGDESVTTLSRDHFVDAQPEMHLLAQLVHAELLFPLEPRQLAHDVAEFADSGLADPPCREAGRLKLQDLPEFVELRHKRWIEFRGKIAETRLADCEPIALEAPESLAERRPAHLDAPCEFSLAQACARLDLARQDHGPERVVRDPAQWLRALAGSIHGGADHGFS